MDENDFFEDEDTMYGAEMSNGVAYMLDRVNTQINMINNQEIMKTSKKQGPVGPVEQFWDSGIEVIDTCGTSPETVEVILYPVAKAKIETLMDHYDHMEWLAYLLGDVVDGIYHIQDIVVPKQRVTPVAVFDITDPGVRTIGVIHSHHDMGNGFSHTDDEYINQNNDISLCISKKGIQGHVRIKTECSKYILIKAEVKNWNGGIDLDSFISDVEKNITVGRLITETEIPSANNGVFYCQDVSKAVQEYIRCLMLVEVLDNDKIREIDHLINVIDSLPEVGTDEGLIKYSNMIELFFDEIDDMSLESIDLLDEIDVDCEGITATEMKDLNILKRALQYALSGVDESGE